MCAWTKMTEVASVPLEPFIVSQKRRTAPSLCFDAIPDGKPLHTFPGIALAELPDGFAGDHGDGQGDIDAARARLHRDRQPRIRRLVDRIRHAGRFAAEQQDVAVGEGKTGVGSRGFGGEQYQTARTRLAPILEGVPVDMPGQGSHFEVVHAGALECFVGERKAGRLDDIDAETEAGGEAQDCPGVAGDVRLVEGDAETVVHFRVFLISGRSATASGWFWKLLDLRVAIFCEVKYTASIVNPNRWRGNS